MPINISGITLGQSTKDATALPCDVKIGKIFYGADGKHVGTLLHKNSLILADNVGDLNIISDLNSMKLMWNIPNSEIGIKQFNIYLKKANEAPTDLSQFDLVESVSGTEKTYTITGLESGLKYYVVVESVSVEDYENASLRGMRNAYVRKGYWITFAKDEVYSDYLFWFSENGENWEKLKNTKGEDVVAHNNYGRVDRLLVVDEKIYFNRADSDSYPRVYYLDHNNGSILDTNCYFSSCKHTECLFYTGKRFVASANTGNEIYYYYCMDYPEKTKNWISMGKGSYAFSSASHNDLIVTAQYTNLWGYYDFNNENQWGEIDGTVSPSLTDLDVVCYGNSIYVFGGEYGTSIYVTENNVKNGSYVYVSKGNSQSSTYAGLGFYDVIYSPSSRKFFAINVSGETFYMNDTGNYSWKKMNGKIERGKLAYGNGRLVCRGAKNKSWYCINGMDWVSMTGISGDKNTIFNICSLYD